MKKILVTAGGTATAWHIAQVAKEHLADLVEVQVCDTNEQYLVPVTAMNLKVHKVPPVVAPEYLKCVGKIVEDEKIDCIIPLIPQEAYLFAKDSKFINMHHIKSSVPPLETTKLLTDKLNMYHTLLSLNIPTPKILERDEALDSKKYLVKPRLGFGSSGVKVIMGSDYVPEDCIIQEYCHDEDYDEVTVEVYNGENKLHILARRRIATKIGVCVKMEPVDGSIFFPHIKKIVENIVCPKAFNVQFLWHNGVWKLFDCNLRLGAGTALSTAIGFQLTRALLAELIEVDVEENWFKIDESVKAVLRVYQEIVVR